MEIRYNGEETLRIRFEPDSLKDNIRACDYRFSKSDEMRRTKGGNVEINFLDEGADKRLVMPYYVAEMLLRQLRVLIQDTGGIAP